MNLLTDIGELLLPHQCPLCKRILSSGKMCVCHRCLSRLEYVSPAYVPYNALESRLPCKRAAALLKYTGRSMPQRLIHAMKFRGGRRLCLFMGRTLGSALRDSGFFDGVDVIVPVPLHPKRRRERGYNQCELITRGLSEVTGIPVCGDVLYQHKLTPNQSSLSLKERADNRRGAFALSPDVAALKGRHLLLVDDVVTTGATVSACAGLLSGIEGVEVSVAAVASTLFWT